MVLRDIDIIGRLKNCEVGLTVTTTDDALGRFMEVRATSTSMRIGALKQLGEAGIRTYAFVGPLLAHFKNSPELLDELFSRLADAGVKDVYVEHINLSPYIRKRLFDLLSARPELQPAYADAAYESHRSALDAMVKEQMARHGLTLRLNGVIYHKEWIKDGGKSGQKAITYESNP